MKLAGVGVQFEAEYCKALQPSTPPSQKAQLRELRVRHRSGVILVPNIFRIAPLEQQPPDTTSRADLRICTHAIPSTVSDSLARQAPCNAAKHTSMLRLPSPFLCSSSLGARGLQPNRAGRACDPEPVPGQHCHHPLAGAGAAVAGWVGGAQRRLEPAGVHRKPAGCAVPLQRRGDPRAWRFNRGVAY